MYQRDVSNCFVSTFSPAAQLKARISQEQGRDAKELTEEREHHQRLIKEYSRLQQRFENLQGEMQVLTSPTGLVPTARHQRSLSGISNISLESASSVATETSTLKNGEDEVSGWRLLMG